MREKHLATLEKVGLSTAEAQIYLALVRNGAPMGASAVVTATGVPRSSVYPTLSALVDKGLVESEAGYGGRFSAVPAEQALASLIVREKEELSQREKLARELADELKSARAATEGNYDTEAIQVLRDPRVISERFDRLQLEAEKQVEVFIKGPIFNPQYTNPIQEKAMRRGVRYRGLYERGIVDAPEIKRFLAKWIAGGEEARSHDGELPHKLAIFDRQNILLPLATPGGKIRTLSIRHPQLANSLGLLFDFLWERAEPISVATPERMNPRTGSRAKSPNEPEGSNSAATSNGSQRKTHAH